MDSTQPVTSAASELGPKAGYDSLTDEVIVDQLQVEGTFPNWIHGTLLRNGPALFEDRERSVRHAFDGQAMLHRFSLTDGKVSYANRFLRTKAYEAMRRGRMTYSEFATDPCRSIFKRAMTFFASGITDNAAVALTKLGERHYAMTEAPMSVEFDPETLSTLGYGPRAPGIFATAHPHRDPDSEALINVATRFGPVNAYRFFAQSPEGKPRVLASERVREPGYVHSFAMSKRYIAHTEFPFVVNPVEIPLKGKPFIENFRWKPERGTRIIVWDRRSGRKVGTFETEAGFAFHHVGAWEEDDRLVVEFVDHGTPEVIDALYLDRLRSTAPTRTTRQPPRLRRVTLNLRAMQLHSELRSDATIELPRINEDRYLTRYRFIYGIATSPQSSYETADQLVKLDNESGETTLWREPNCYPGEPIFVPSPDSSREDAGAVLSVVLDAARGRSFLLALDADSLEELGRAYAPHVIPHGIHGAFYAVQR